ncbi:MAG: hypothetical protein WCH43_16565, partial [Verrucomicrobiota bacterium]
SKLKVFELNGTKDLLVELTSKRLTESDKLKQPPPTHVERDAAMAELEAFCEQMTDERETTEAELLTLKTPPSKSGTIIRRAK